MFNGVDVDVDVVVVDDEDVVVVVDVFSPIEWDRLPWSTRGFNIHNDYGEISPAKRWNFVDMLRIW